MDSPRFIGNYTMMISAIEAYLEREPTISAAKSFGMGK